MKMAAHNNCRWHGSEKNSRHTNGRIMDTEHTHEPKRPDKKYTADIRESASVAHIYGQNLVAAESLTALGIGGTAWSYSPENLKPSVDLEMANGLNRFVIHCSPHQPVDDKIRALASGHLVSGTRVTKPGQNRPLHGMFISRSSYMLQQGKFVADVVILLR